MKTHPLVVLSLSLFLIAPLGCSKDSQMQNAQDAHARAEAAFRRIKELGGDGVWESELVALTLADSAITDEDLVLFGDLPFVEYLALDNTAVSDSGLHHLECLTALKRLTLVNTKVTLAGVERLRRILPSAEICLDPLQRPVIDPFTGAPLKGNR